MPLFELRFDPAARRRRGGEQAPARRDPRATSTRSSCSTTTASCATSSGLIDATVRTNVYRPGRDAMAFKLRSAEVPAIPQPAPLFEIYVYAPDMEGIHLRGGRIARGGHPLVGPHGLPHRGLRPHARADDQERGHRARPAPRAGSSSRRRPRTGARCATRCAPVRRATSRRCSTSPTTSSTATVVHPEGVVVHDEDDTYLVVAADKGTATFSDTANEIAVRRGFWLGDAFASGGSAGYDHKALGSPPSGAWESVKRHFRELGIDPETDVVTAVGIGDMSGDVFGNGMLLSRTLQARRRLRPPPRVHRPRSRPGRSFDERKRLFELRGLVVGRLRQGR